MRPVCPTGIARGRRVADLPGDVAVVHGQQPYHDISPHAASYAARSVARSGRRPPSTGGGRTSPLVPSGIIARVSGIYEEPELYQLACAYRDVPAEVTALLSWCATHWRGDKDGDNSGDGGGPA